MVHEYIYRKMLFIINVHNIYLYNKTRHSYIYMLRKAGQTAGPIGLKFCVDTLNIFFSSKFFSTGSAGYFS